MIYEGGEGGKEGGRGGGRPRADEESRALLEPLLEPAAGVVGRLAARGLPELLEELLRRLLRVVERKLEERRGSHFDVEGEAELPLHADAVAPLAEGVPLLDDAALGVAWGRWTCGGRGGGVGGGLGARAAPVAESGGRRIRSAAHLQPRIP